MTQPVQVAFAIGRNVNSPVPKSESIKLERTKQNIKTKNWNLSHAMHILITFKDQN